MKKIAFTFLCFLSLSAYAQKAPYLVSEKEFEAITKPKTMKIGGDWHHCYKETFYASSMDNHSGKWNLLCTTANGKIKCKKI